MQATPACTCQSGFRRPPPTAEQCMQCWPFESMATCGGDRHRDDLLNFAGCDADRAWRSPQLLWRVAFVHINRMFSNATYLFCVIGRDYRGRNCERLLFEQVLVGPAAAAHPDVDMHPWRGQAAM